MIYFSGYLYTQHQMTEKNAYFVVKIETVDRDVPQEKKWGGAIGENHGIRVFLKVNFSNRLFKKQ